MRRVGGDGGVNVHDVWLCIARNGFSEKSRKERVEIAREIGRGRILRQRGRVADVLAIIRDSHNLSTLARATPVAPTIRQVTGNLP